MRSWILQNTVIFSPYVHQPVRLFMAYRLTFNQSYRMTSTTSTESSITRLKREKQKGEGRRNATEQRESEGKNMRTHVAANIQFHILSSHFLRIPRIYTYSWAYLTFPLSTISIAFLSIADRSFGNLKPDYLTDIYFYSRKVY